MGLDEENGLRLATPIFTAMAWDNIESPGMARDLDSEFGDGYQVGKICCCYTGTSTACGMIYGSFVGEELRGHLPRRTRTLFMLGAGYSSL
jgi:hypothetical protein